jgi:hypothetical protein
MTNRYEGRVLYDVSAQVHLGIGDARTKHAAPTVNCDVQISLKAKNVDLQGPTATLSFAIDPIEGATLAEVERAAIAAAHELLCHFAGHGVDALLAQRETMFAYDLKEPDYAIDLSTFSRDGIAEIPDS